MSQTGDLAIALPEWELQQDIYSILNADATIKTTLGASVYDAVPQPSSFPYVRIASSTDNPEYWKTGAFANVSETIHIHSTYRGAKEVNQLATAICSALTGGTYSLTGFQVVDVSRGNLIVLDPEFDDQDRERRHAILYMNYRIK